MTFFIRLITAGGLFVPLLVIIYFAICVIGGGVQGGKIAIEHPNDPNITQLEMEAGVNFVKNNLGIIVFTAFSVAFIFSTAISFSGILPWCKQRSE